MVDTWRGSCRVDTRTPPTETDDDVIVTTRQYRVRQDDLASTLYRFLGKSKWKPPVMATAPLVRLCEMTAMLVLPGVTLGRRLVIDHEQPVVRGVVVTLTATCTPRDGGWWECKGVATADNMPDPVAKCELLFLADVDRQRFARKLAPLYAARGWAVTLWLRVLDGLALLSFLAMPLQVAYLSRHLWASRVAETALILVWFVAQKGWFGAIKDWLTLRPVSSKTMRSSIPVPRKAKASEKTSIRGDSRARVAEAG